MPYVNIVWIKLQVRLLNDHRFFGMTERSQLFYIKILLLCGANKNKVPKLFQKLRALLRTDCSEVELNESIKEIRSNFPKLMETEEFYFIRGFKSLHNWCSPGSSAGTPKDAVEKKRKEKIRKEYITDVSEFYVLKKQFPRDELCNDDWVRIQTATRNLILKTKTTDIAKEAISWQSEQEYPWTLETVVKKYPEFLVNRKSDAVRKFEEAIDRSEKERLSKVS